MIDVTSLSEEEKAEVIKALKGEEYTEHQHSFPEKHVKCSNGFECDLPADVVDDWEIMKDLNSLSSDKSDASAMLVLPRIFERIFTPEDYDRLQESCRVNGKIKASMMVLAFQEIFEQLNLKN